MWSSSSSHQHRSLMPIKIPFFSLFFSPKNTLSNCGNYMTVCPTSSHCYCYSGSTRLLFVMSSQADSSDDQYQHLPDVRRSNTSRPIWWSAASGLFRWSTTRWPIRWTIARGLNRWSTTRGSIQWEDQPQVDPSDNTPPNYEGTEALDTYLYNSTGAPTDMCLDESNHSGPC